MKLIDAIKQNGNPYWIPDCSRDDLPEFFKELGFKIGVEVGVDEGGYTEAFAKSGLQIYGVDPWKVYRDYENRGDQATLDLKYAHTQRVLAPYPDCTIIRKTSMEAVENFEDESLDFVYIDGNHNFRYIAEDISEWTKKVKKGGIVSGHDYEGGGRNRFVTYIVNAFVKSYGINNWYIIGKLNPLPGERNDITLSWMFLKYW